MATKTSVTITDLARDLAQRHGMHAEEALTVLQTICDLMRERLSAGHSIQLGDILSLTVAGGPELREDESGGFSAYAPELRSIAAHPLGSLKDKLDRSCQAAIYYVAKGDGAFKELLGEHFGRRGWQLVHTHNGMEVLGRLDRHPPVALVYESAANGWHELVRELKCDPHTNWVPVVGIFPEGADDEPVRRLTVQPDEMITEPFDFTDFIRTAGAELAERVTAHRHDLTELGFLLPGTQRDRKDACHMIEEVLFRSGLAEEFCRAASGALFEALDNAVRHGHRNIECCSIDVRMILDPKRLVLAVRDTGTGFDHAAALTAARGNKMRGGAADPLARAAAVLKTRRGDVREGGIARMLSLVDRVDYNKRGNEVVLIKHRPDDDCATDTNPLGLDS